MTSGERMVWAAAFAQALDAGNRPDAAAAIAAASVEMLGRADVADLKDSARAMVRDMLSTGGDR